MSDSYMCVKCLVVSSKQDLKKDAKKRKGVIKNLKQCPVKGCGSTVFYGGSL